MKDQLLNGKVMVHIKKGCGNPYIEASAAAICNRFFWRAVKKCAKATLYTDIDRYLTCRTGRSFYFLFLINPEGWREPNEICSHFACLSSFGGRIFFSLEKENKYHK
jgi:hypothetical protein